MSINHDFRRKGIGASDVAAILQISPWQTPLALWHYIKHGIKQPDTKPKKKGRELEGQITTKYEKDTGLLFLRNQEMVDDRNEIWRCNLDAFSIDPRLVVEIKTANKRKGWGKEGTCEIPNHYITQVAYQRAIAKTDRVDVVVKFDNDEKLYCYHYEPNFPLEERLREKVLEWWETYIIGDIPPPAINDKDKNNFEDTKILVAPSHIIELCVQAQLKRDAEKRAATEQKEIREAIEAWMREKNADGKATIVDDKGNSLVMQYFSNRSNFDKARAEKDGIDVDKYTINKLSKVLKIK